MNFTKHFANTIEKANKKKQMSDIKEIFDRFYKRNKPSIVIHDDAIGELERKLATAIQERDDARREVCESDTDTHGGALLEADRRGWDCFKKDNHIRNSQMANEANTNNQIFREGRL